MNKDKPIRERLTAGVAFFRNCTPDQLDKSSIVRTYLPAFISLVEQYLQENSGEPVAEPVVEPPPETPAIAPDDNTDFADALFGK